MPYGDQYFASVKVCYYLNQCRFMGFPGTHLRAVSKEVIKISVCKMSLKTTHVKLIPHISGANGIINYTYVYITIHHLLPNSVWLVQTLQKLYFDLNKHLGNYISMIFLVPLTYILWNKLTSNLCTVYIQIRNFTLVNGNVKKPLSNICMA